MVYMGNMLKTALLLGLACFTLSLQAQNSYAEQYQPVRRDPAFRIVLSPLHRTQLSSQIVSPVLYINKRMGESFKQGDELIQLDDAIFQANLKKAQASLVKAKTELESKQRLFSDRVASLFEIKDAEANVAVAEADLIKAQKELDAAHIIAPYKGKVVAVNIEEHELAEVGKKILEIVEDQKLIGELLLPSNMLPKVAIGQPISILIKETGEPITAKITRIGAVIDPASSTVKVEAEIDNSADKLRAGMSGTATFSNDANKS